jgi:hypothetical protein
MNPFPFPARDTAASTQSAAPRPMPGNGTRLTTSSLGYSYSSLPGEASYPHPFKPSLSGQWISLSLGLVENREPTIGGLPLSDPLARLRLEPNQVNRNGESWVCVEATLNEEGVIATESRVEIVHRGEPRSLSKTVARAPLCLVLWRNQRPERVLAIVHFNLRYARVLPPPGGGAVRHLFF